MIMNVVGGEDHAAVPLGDPIEPLDPARIVTAIKPARRDMTKGSQCVAQSGQFLFKDIEIAVRPRNEGDAFPMRRDFGESQFTFALLGAHLTETEQPREAAIPIATTG